MGVYVEWGGGRPKATARWRLKAAQGMAVGGPKRIVEHNPWSAVMRPWRQAGVVPSVGVGGWLVAEGERCPVCGRGRLYRVAPGMDIRLDGHALLSAVRYVLEKFRCSACGQVFTAATPPEAGADKYSARARAVLVLGRYYLGVPLYRLEGYQAMVGVPVADATQWDQIERVADCAYPVFEQLKTLAAQGEVIYQDDTHVRILSLIAENRQAHTDDTSEGRTGMYTTGLVVQQDEHTICLYFAGRAHAGENLEALLTRREADRGKPLVMSDALANNNTADEGALIGC